MSRIAKAPISIPGGVTLEIRPQEIRVKGPKASLSMKRNPLVNVIQEGDLLRVSPVDDKKKESWAMAGTTRALLNNMIIGCTRGFEKKMALVGVGYRAQAKGDRLTLNLGFSHPVEYAIPDGIQVTTPSATEILITGADKQQVGQVAAEIRQFRPPEPYKGKGVRYADEQVMRKDAKKK